MSFDSISQLNISKFGLFDQLIECLVPTCVTFRSDSSPLPCTQVRDLYEMWEELPQGSRNGSPQDLRKGSQQEGILQETELYDLLDVRKSVVGQKELAA